MGSLREFCLACNGGLTFYGTSDVSRIVALRSLRIAGSLRVPHHHPHGVPHASAQHSLSADRSARQQGLHSPLPALPNAAVRAQGNCHALHRPEPAGPAPAAAPSSRCSGELPAGGNHGAAAEPARADHRHQPDRGRAAAGAGRGAVPERR